MRIADKMNYEQVKSNLAKNRTDMAELQNQAATQKKLTRPSDDPQGATRVLSARTEIHGNKQFLKNINAAKSFLEYSEQSVGELADVLVRAKELAISQSNDASANQRSREVTATEVEQLRNQSIQIGNRKLGDRYLFGGFRTTRPPFKATGEYSGDEGQMELVVNKDARISINTPGSNIFLGKALVKPEPFMPTQQAPEAEKKEDTHWDQEVTPAYRGPASKPEEKEKTEAPEDEQNKTGISETWQKTGINVFRVLQDLEISLRANDKAGVQDSLNDIDSALAQVILARAQMGSRIMTLNANMETIQKGQVDAKTVVSNLEDADTFELVSDMNKTESTLKASLQTSGKLIQPSLLDFLR